MVISIFSKFSILIRTIINIKKKNWKNIDIDIKMAILEYIDIDIDIDNGKGIFQNIDIYKILYW